MDSLASSKGQMLLFCTHRRGSQNIIGLKYGSEVNIVCSAHPSHVFSFAFTLRMLVLWEQTACGELLGSQRWDLEKESELYNNGGGIFEGDICYSRYCSPPSFWRELYPSPLSHGMLWQRTAMFLNSPALGAIEIGPGGKWSKLGQSSSSFMIF